MQITRLTRINESFFLIADMDRVTDHCIIILYIWGIAACDRNLPIIKLTQKMILQVKISLKIIDDADRKSNIITS